MLAGRFSRPVLEIDHGGVGWRLGASRRREDEDRHHRLDAQQPVVRSLVRGRHETSGELGYDSTVFDSQNDTAKETAHFENLIAAGYKAVLFNPTDADGSIANVRRAKEAGIPVFCIDREINATDAATSQILSDNYSGCVAARRVLRKCVGEEGQLRRNPRPRQGDNNTWNRSKGSTAWSTDYPGLKMVAQQRADFDRARHWR